MCICPPAARPPEIAHFKYVIRGDRNWGIADWGFGTLTTFAKLQKRQNVFLQEYNLAKTHKLKNAREAGIFIKQ